MKQAEYFSIEILGFFVLVLCGSARPFLSARLFLSVKLFCAEDLPHALLNHLN